MIRSLAFAACLVALPLVAGGVLADDDDQEEARGALQRGEIKPLEQVLAAAKQAAPGDVVKIELDRDDGRWVYEIKILTASGDRREVEIDASSLAVLEVD